MGNKSTLAFISQAYDLPARLKIHPSQPHLLQNPKVKADVFEAYIWAIAKDPALGLSVALDCLKTLFTPLLDLAYEDLKEADEQNPRAKKRRRVMSETYVSYAGRLQEWKSKRMGRKVEYRGSEWSGVPHEPKWEGEMFVNDVSYGKVEGCATQKDAKDA